MEVYISEFGGRQFLVCGEWCVIPIDGITHTSTFMLTMVGATIAFALTLTKRSTSSPITRQIRFATF